MSGILAVISHLMPKMASKKDERQAAVTRNFSMLNEKLRDSLMTAIKIDEQKRLDYIRHKPTL